LAVDPGSPHRAQHHGAVKAINAAYLAMQGDGGHVVSLMW
jgi:hypothetical protein